MRPAIILGAYPVNDYALGLAQYLFDLYKEHLPEAVLYIGINTPSYHEQLVSMLKGYPFEVHHALTPEHLIIRSDASAYQTALRLYKEHNKEYDLLWFQHFKGATHEATRTMAKDRLREQIENRVVIEKTFKNNPLLGLYAHTGWGFNHSMMDPGNSEDYTSHYFDFKYSLLKITALYSIFVARAAAVKSFVDNCSPSFFTEKLGSVYFFENDFSQIIFRQGYTPYLEEDEYCPRQHQDKIIEDWKIQNNIKG